MECCFNKQSPNNMKKELPPIPNNCWETVLFKRWYYGDNVTVEFDLSKWITNTTPINTTKKVTAQFVSFRREEVKTYECNYVAKPSVTITKEDSETYFGKGIYYIIVRIIDTNFQETISDNFMIEVM